jgi:hypothetical protein
MKINSQKSSIRTIRKEDPDFMIRSGFMLGPRAGFEVALGCPKEYRMIITECFDKGWIKPVAYMHEKEFMISGLLKD